MILKNFKLLLNKQNLTNSFWYLSVPAFNFIISTISYPILTQYFIAEDFGIIGYYNSIITFFSIFYSLSFNTYYMSIYNSISVNERYLVVNKLILILIYWNIFFVPFSIVALIIIIKYISVDIPIIPFTILSVLLTFASVFKNYLQIDLRLEKKAFYYFILTVGNKLLGVISTILLLIFLFHNAKSHFWGLFISESLFFLIILNHYKNKEKFSFDLDLAKKTIKITWPLIFASLCYIPCLSYDMVVAERLNNKQELGMFSVGKNIGMYLYTIGFAFYQVVEPGLYKAVVKRNRRKVFQIQALIIISLIILYCILYLALPNILKYLTHNKLSGALQYARITLLMAGCMVFFSSSDAVLTALQKTRTIFWIHLSAAILCFYIHTILSKDYLYIGISYSNFLIFLYIALLSTFFAWINLNKIN